jgi:tetratricopeptide (TPR) repeat protein/tRNA A-37 threonylcarbamoyl transferase component Bud32
MAEQEEPVRRRVALKVIKLGMDTKQVIARFEAERQALAMMDHPNIARVLDAGATDTGRPYFVMELVRGVKITDLCDEQSLSTEDRLKLFIQVCHAIQHAHQKGVIHRDIKPSNILVTVNDGMPVPKVIDFGIAKATAGRLTDQTLLTAFEQFIGTPAYMSPEQAVMTSLDIDTRSDIYSLGVLLYELLTGKTPFDANELLAAGLDEMRRTIREREPARPSTRLSSMVEGELTTTAKHRHTEAPKLIHVVRADLDWIVMKCLEKDRARRYATANGLATDIARHLNDEPIVARPPSKLYRFQKLVSRNKLTFAAAGAVVASLCLGLGLSTWLFLREREALRVQSQLRHQAWKEAAKSQQIAQFLKEMLSGVGPSAALGQDTKLLRGIVDRTAQRIGRDLTGHPDVEAELLQTLGDVSFLIKQYDKAEMWSSQALELRQQVFGKESGEAANSLDSLALVLYGQGKLAEAEKLALEALALQRRHGNSTNIATSLNNLGIILTVAGRWDEAKAAYLDALTIRTNLFGNEHPEVAVTLNCLAQALQGRGMLPEAELAQRQSIAIQRKVLPDPHPDLALSLNNLANSLQLQGKFDQAQPLYRDTLKLYKSLLGDRDPEVATPLNNYGLLFERMGLWAESEATHLEALSIRTNAFTGAHPHVAFSLNNLASLRASTGRFEEAVALHRQALAMRIAIYGETNTYVAESMSNLARVLRQQGRLSEAETMQTDALTRRQKLPPAGEHPSVAVSLNELGLVRQAQGRLREAETVLRDALALRTKALRSDDSNLAESAENLAQLLCDVGQFAEAEKLARQSQAIREANYPEDWRRYNTLAIAGTALLGQKKYARAEPLLLSGYQGMEQRQARIPTDGKPRPKEVVERIKQLYEATGQSDKAAEWKQKLFGFEPAK